MKKKTETILKKNNFSVSEEIKGFFFENFDLYTNIILKLNLYQNKKDKLNTFEKTFISIWFLIVSQNPMLSPKRFMSILSLSFFKKKFLVLTSKKIAELRSDYLLSESKLVDLINLDVKSRQLYFDSLEEKLLLQNLNFLKEIKETSFQLLFYRIRKKIIMESLKKNIQNAVFWGFILIAVFLGLTSTSKENSYTILEQIKEWIKFFLNRT